VGEIESGAPSSVARPVEMRCHCHREEGLQRSCILASVGGCFASLFAERVELCSIPSRGPSQEERNGPSHLLKALAWPRPSPRCALIRRGRPAEDTVCIYRPPNLNLLFNQSNMVVTVETDIGITGLGEGGSKDTLEQCAGTLIGKNPFRIDAIWQEAYIAWFYPPGREKTHALGALDLALWDIKGKALGVPVHELLGHGRDHSECCGTAARCRRLTPCTRFPALSGDDAGFAPSAWAGRHPVGGSSTARGCQPPQARDLREGRARRDWCITHQRFDFNDGLRACRGIEEFEPYFVEDPVRDEHALMDLPKLRMMTTVPLTHGEEWGHRWDFNKLVENHDIDYIRATLPNVGGITEMMKIAAICETHAVGIVPHFTGPVATAALVNCLSTFSGPIILEYNFGGRVLDYLPEHFEFRDGKFYTNQRPGLGVTVDMTKVTPIGEVTKPGTRNLYERPDGSLTHW
jgi:L-alanine-DL-glutamate epimerase-like enolase superfamily enzyme